MDKHLRMTLTVLILTLASGAAGPVAAQGLRGNPASFGTGWQVGGSTPDQGSTSATTGSYGSTGAGSAASGSAYSGSSGSSYQGSGSSYGAATTPGYGASTSGGASAAPPTPVAPPVARTRGNGLRPQ